MTVVRPDRRGVAPPPFELPDELAIDTAIARRIVAEFIRGQLRQAGFERAVLGLSGGIDSALVAYLTAEAIGAERLECVLMPYRTSSPASRADAETVVADLGCASSVVDISPMVDGYFETAAGPEGGDASALRRGNFAARMRMAVLYDRSVTWGGLVVGTGNKTETLIGYTTLFGDAACAFNPIGDLYKSQVRQLAVEVGVPDAIVRKAPSADLWPGQTDEAEGGFQLSGPRPAAVLDDRQAAVRRGARRARLRRGHHRAGQPPRRGLGVQAPGPTDRQARPADGRGRLPVSPTAPGLGTEMTDEPTEGGTLYVVATPIGNLADVTMRSIEVLNSVPLVAAEDTRLTRRLFARHGIETRLTPFHARSAPARLAELVGHLRSGSDLALVTDAGTPGVSDPGEALVASWAAEGGRVVPIPGASALLAAIVAAGIAGPRWSFEGFLPRTGRERQDRLARIAGDERGTVLFEAPGRLVGTLGDLAETCGHGPAGDRLPGAHQAPRDDPSRDPRRAGSTGPGRRDRDARRDHHRRRLVAGRERARGRCQPRRVSRPPSLVSRRSSRPASPAARPPGP